MNNFIDKIVNKPNTKEPSTIYLCKLISSFIVLDPKIITKRKINISINIKFF